MRVSISAPAMPVFAILLACSPALAQTMVQPAARPDTDVQCAATFTVLENSARASGVSNGSFGAMVAMIQQVHMAANPGENAESFARIVSNTALSLQQAMASGALGFNAVQTQVAACNARYRSVQGAG